MARKAKIDPATGKPVARKPRKERIKHPLVGAAKGYPFDATPTDFDAKLHKPLKKKDFANLGGFFDYKANVIETRAAKMTQLATKLRKRAETERNFKDDDTRKAVHKAEKMKDSLLALKETLAAKGVKLEDYIAGLTVDAPAAVA